MKPAARVFKNEKGVALILTLLVLTLMVVAGLELNRATRVEANLAGNFRDLTQAYYIALSGVEIARGVLQEDGQSFGPEAKWRQFEALSVFSSQLFPEGSFSGRIEDESAKFNPNALIDPTYSNEDPKKVEQLKKLITLLGYTPEKVMDAILDWIDPNAVNRKRPFGASREYYLSLKPPYSPKNGRLDSVGEMLLIKGVDADFFYGKGEREGLQRYLTVYTDAGNAKINVNTAGVPMLMSLKGVDQSMAQALVAVRQQKAITSADELRRVAGWSGVFSEISSEVGFTSNYFSIHVNGFYRGAQATVQAVVERSGNRTTIKSWKAG